jgi:hypothetical protein
MERRWPWHPVVASASSKPLGPLIPPYARPGLNVSRFPVRTRIGCGAAPGNRRRHALPMEEPEWTSKHRRQLRAPRRLCTSGRAPPPWVTKCSARGQAWPSGGQCGVGRAHAAPFPVEKCAPSTPRGALQPGRDGPGALLGPDGQGLARALGLLQARPKSPAASA